MIALLESEQFELPFMRTTHPVKTKATTRTLASSPTCKQGAPSRLWKPSNGSSAFDWRVECATCGRLDTMCRSEPLRRTAERALLNTS
jgi:hypothetical protein